MTQAGPVYSLFFPFLSVSSHFFHYFLVSSCFPCFVFFQFLPILPFLPVSSSFFLFFPVSSRFLFKFNSKSSALIALALVSISLSYTFKKIGLQHRQAKVLREYTNSHNINYVVKVTHVTALFIGLSRNLTETKK